MKTFIAALVLLASSLTLSRPASAQAAYDCLISYDDTFALTNYYDQDRTQFAVETRANSKTGKLESCTPFADDNWRACWAYRQRCSYTTFYVNQWPWGVNNHHHMPFDNPYLQDPICTCDPRDGYGIGYGFKIPTSSTTSKCFSTPCPNWKTETHPYTTVGHLGTDWTYIYVEKGGDRTQHVFYLQDITIGGTVPVQLWYVDKAGNSWGWTYLQPGYWWLDAGDVVAVWIGNANLFTRSTPASIIDYVIWPQY